MLSKEEIKEYILSTETAKHPLLNEIYAIRDKRKETQDYTIYVDGYISVDVLNKTLKLESDKQKLIEKLEKKIRYYEENDEILATSNDNYSDGTVIKKFIDEFRDILSILKGE